MVERNRRQYPRVKLKQVSTRITAGGALHIGLPVENVSLGGCFVPTRTPLKVGTEVRLEMQRLGVSHAINVLGRVVSTAVAKPGQLGGMGIAFFPMSRETSLRIEGLIGQVDPAAVRANVEAAGRSTDPETPAVSGRALVPAAEVAALREQLSAYAHEVKQKDARIAELEATVKRVTERLLRYGGKP